MTDRPRRTGPDHGQLLAAADRTVPPLLAPDLRVLFCGINPGLYTAWTGHHFARPGNRFWPALHRSGFTDRQLAPAEQEQLLTLGLGITNVAARASARADELSRDELRAGALRLGREVDTYRPRWLAVLGITAYRQAFDRPKAVLGPQDDPVGDARVWVLPNPSGLNAHHTPTSLAGLFGELRTAVEADGA
ncbi:G/U mismatch-specific DNA glycosylase [Aquipuribacter sp. MA13-6]|uniref:G/U mismatch-specific DNA glycosylase n=1 Tax=unclassified Aquipuribacter TaxID=2635084 RepID=UPI003EEA1066